MGYLGGTVSPWVSRATLIGAADESKRVMITAYLGWRDQSAL
jgi:hypothetical protein